jgi:hypothetical protein
LWARTWSNAKSHRSGQLLLLGTTGQEELWHLPEE